MYLLCAAVIIAWGEEVHLTESREGLATSQFREVGNMMELIIGRRGEKKKKPGESQWKSQI